MPKLAQSAAQPPPPRSRWGSVPWRSPSWMAMPALLLLLLLVRADAFSGMLREGEFCVASAKQAADVGGVTTGTDAR